MQRDVWMYKRAKVQRTANLISLVFQVGRKVSALRDIEKSEFTRRGVAPRRLDVYIDTSRGCRHELASSPAVKSVHNPPESDGSSSSSKQQSEEEPRRERGAGKTRNS